MIESTKVKKRRVMSRDHDDIANFITRELKARQDTEWRRKHEARWREVDRQIAIEPPATVKEDKNDSGDWHNAIQLGDLTDASETITADILRLVFPTERKWFVPHVRLPSVGTDDDGDEIPHPPEVQRQANGVVRSFMVQQHKDFGVRGRVKLGLKEVLHHGSVVATVDEQRLVKFEGGAKPDHLTAPVPEIHSMWNCYPDSSPMIQGTELFYSGSMIIRKYISLQAALEMPGWINKNRLREAHKGKKDLTDHIEIVTYYGDIFLKRHDGNILFPNRKTTVSGHVFLDSKVNATAYSPVIYTGYERDDVRDPYFTSPIVKRAPMGAFATKMANNTMDAVDLAVKPPGQYDSTDNSLKGNPPKIYPGAMFGSRGGQGVDFMQVGDPAAGLAGVQFAKQSLQGGTTVDATRQGVAPIKVGDSAAGLAGMQFAKQSMQEGTTVDATRKGVSPGTEQTATEVQVTEQRAEVREVEFSSSFEAGFLLPYLIMQNDINREKLQPYRFYNDEPHTPDFMVATRKDVPKQIVFEVTGSRTLLGEQERTQRFGQTAALASQNEILARETDWQEVARQLWEDSKQKDPERFLRSGARNEEIEAALAEAQQQFEAQMQQVQEQAAQLQEQAQKAADEARKQTVRAEQAALKSAKADLEKEQLQVKNTTLGEQLKLTKEMERAEDQLQRLQRDIEKREAQLQCKEGEGSASGERGGRMLELVETILKE